MRSRAAKAWLGRGVVALLAAVAVNASLSGLGVEHDPALLACADWLLELGPGGGPDGPRAGALSRYLARHREGQLSDRESHVRPRWAGGPLL